MKDVYVQTASFSRELRADFDGSIEKIRLGGYSGLELFDGIYGGYGPKELKAYLADKGMTVIGAHVSTDNTDEQLAYLPETGCRYVINPGLRIASRDDAFRAAELLNRNGEKAKAAGMIYGYHNHSNDFDKYDGRTVIDILIRETDPALVTFELDAAWAWRAGVNAAEFVKTYSGRFALIHAKETSRVFGPEDDLHKLFAGVKRGPDGFPQFTPEQMKVLEEHRKVNCALGKGIVNMPELKAVADAQGCQGYIVEREYAYTGDIFTSLAEDCAYMHTI